MAEQKPKSAGQPKPAGKDAKAAKVARHFAERKRDGKRETR